MTAVLAACGAYTYVTAQFRCTRQVAAVSIAMAATELIVAGLPDLAAFPWLTGILLLSRAVVLLCCVGALRRDRRAARRRAQRRAAYARQMRCAQHPLHALSSADSRRTASCA